MTSRYVSGFTVAGWLARLLAAFAALFVICLWCFVPNDPALSAHADMWAKLKPISVAVIALLGLLRLPRWCFRKRMNKR